MGMKSVLCRIVAMMIALLAVCAGVGADPHPAGLKDHKFNPVDPVTEDGVTTFRIFDRKCSDVPYGDGRGETDCHNGNVRSILSRGFSEQLGDTVEYRFDIFVEKEFRYRGYENPHAWGFLGVGQTWPLQNHDSRLRIASWEGPLLHNFIYMLKLDSLRGAYFLDETCFGPDRFGEWNSFSMKIRWADDDRGWIRVACNGETIHLAEGLATNQAPHCYITNQCEPNVEKHPEKFLFALGPVMAGFGPEWKKFGKLSQFTDIQPEGITLRMRNIEIDSGASLYGPDDREIIRELQAHLNALGCNAGPVDGIAGEKTRAAALECREFTGSEFPENLTVLTAPVILAAYREKFPVD